MPTASSHRARPSLAALIALCSLAWSTGASAQWPPEIKNLQVLPADLDARQVIGQMRQFSFALGVRCQHCHVGEEGAPLPSFDFASDEKEAKRTARVMLQMVETINREHLGGLGDDRLRVDCMTCHRGGTRPEQLSALLVRLTLESGIDTALARYAELREEYYGAQTYDFSEASLILAGEGLLGEARPAAAVTLLELNLEHHPDSSWTLGSLAQAQEAAGDAEAAIDTWKRIAARSPDDPRPQQQIERLQAGG